MPSSAYPAQGGDVKREEEEEGGLHSRHTLSPVKGGTDAYWSPKRCVNT